MDLEGNGSNGNVNTGAIRITSAIDDDIGFAQVALRGLWIEGNFGTRVLVEAASGLTLSIQDTLMLNPGANGDKELWIVDADRVSIRDTMAPSAGTAEWDITCDYLTLDNVIVGVLSDSGVVNPNYRGVGTTAVNYIKGRTSSYTGTLTG